MISFGSKQLIAKAIEKLRDNYPSLFIGDKDQWNARANQYWQKLRKYEVDVVEEACDLATEKYPDKFPSSGQLVMLCKGIVHEREKTAYTRDQQAQLAREARENREAVEMLRKDIIPNDRAGQADWIAEGDTPFERLARESEVRSKRMNIDPNDTTPREEAAYRMRAINDLLGANNFFAMAPTQQPQPFPTGPTREPGEDG